MFLRKSIQIPNQTLQICGSKSLSNRYLILNALFTNIKIQNISDSQDTKVLQDALSSENEIIDVKHAGTAMRFLTSYFSIQQGRKVILSGSKRLCERPIKDLVEALRSMGAQIRYLSQEGYPPLEIVGKELSCEFIQIPAHISSQFISSLMLIAPKLKKGIVIELMGKVTSKPYIEMTIDTLKNIGISVQQIDNKIKIAALHLNTTKSNIQHVNIESDWSSASYYYSVAAIGKKTIELNTFYNQSNQADSIIKELYWKYFGVNTITNTQENKIILSPEKRDTPSIINIDMNNSPDIVQTLCVTAATLKIPFHITGLETLRIKETDRILALHNELKKIGCYTVYDDNSIKTKYFTNTNENCSIETYNDHRMAMSFAPFCLMNSITIHDPRVVEKSYPSFWNDFLKIIQPL